MATKITVLTDGPLRLEGDIQLADAQGQPIASGGDTAYLCRCGASAKKPFCDGGHKKIPFRG